MEPVLKRGSSRNYGHTIGPAQRDLEAWCGGRSLTPGVAGAGERIVSGEYDSGFKGYLRIRGEALDGCRGLYWSVQFAQAGDPDSHGLVGGAGSAEDACDQACELIREHDAEALLVIAPLGLA